MLLPYIVLQRPSENVCAYLESLEFFPLRQAVVLGVTASAIVELCELEDTQTVILKAEKPQSQETT